MDDVVVYYAFISFFPQLVAGPIERATNLISQFFVPRTINYANIREGLEQMLWGFFKKVVIADNCSMVVEGVFGHYDHYSFWMLALATGLFFIQVYGDFSGYSDIAIGTARLFGFKLMRNCDNPFFSRDLSELWRCRHISLTTWFRDYLFFPLGGSRGSLANTCRNVMIIFIVSGFWHGANWTYIAWGALNGFFLLPSVITKGYTKNYVGQVAEGKMFPSLLDRLGLSYEEVAERHPGVEYVSLSGFGNRPNADGEVSPYRDWPAYASVVEAMSGVYEWARRPGEAPRPNPVGALGDISSALFAVVGILAALRERDRTGRGQQVDVAMLDALLSMTDVVTNMWSLGVRPDNPMQLILEAFAASDGYVVVQVVREHQFERLAELVGRSEWLDDPRFSPRAGWVAHLGDVIRPAVEAWLATRTRAEATPEDKTNKGEAKPVKKAAVPRKPGETPAATSTTGKVWVIADRVLASHSDITATTDWKPIRDAIIAACESEGINKATAATQYSKFKASKIGTLKS